MAVHDFSVASHYVWVFAKWKILALGFGKILKKYFTFLPQYSAPVLHRTRFLFWIYFVSCMLIPPLPSPFFFFSLPPLYLVFHFFPFDSAPLLLPNLLLPCVPVFPPSLCVCPLTSPVFLPETSLPIDCLSLTCLHSLHSCLFFFFFCFVSPPLFLKWQRSLSNWLRACSSQREKNFSFLLQIARLVTTSKASVIFRWRPCWHFIICGGNVHFWS